MACFSLPTLLQTRETRGKLSAALVLQTISDAQQSAAENTRNVSHASNTNQHKQTHLHRLFHIYCIRPSSWPTSSVRSGFSTAN